MAGVFRGAQSIADKMAPIARKIDPLGQKVMSRLDAGGNAMGVYGSDAKKPIFDPGGDATGLYGKNSKDADAQTMENARATALQEGNTDLEGVNQRTSAALADKNKRKTGTMLLGDS